MSQLNISEMDCDERISWMMSSRGVELGVRTLTSSDLPAVGRMVQEEKWLKSVQSVMNVKQLSPRGALVAVNTQGEVTAFITSVDIGPFDTAVLYIIVDKRYRKLGIGRELINGLATHHGKRVISLLAYPGAESFYFDLGFESIDNMAVVVNFIQPNYERLSKVVTCKGKRKDIDFKESVQFSKLAAYDKRVCGYDRSEYLSTILLSETSNMLIAVKKDAHNEVVGYCGASLVNGNTLCVAPLYAESEELAELLFTKILLDCKKHLKFDQVKIITPMVNPFLSTLGEVTKTLLLQLMTNGEINFGLSQDVFSCINTSFP